MMDTRVKGEGSLWPWVAAGVVLALALGVGAYFYFRETRPLPPPAETTSFGPMTSYKGPTLAVTLYFPTRDGNNLTPEVRDVRELPDKPGQVREVVSELIRGPVTELTPSFPAGTRVKGVFIDDKGTAYIDFSRELQTEYPGGAWTETLTIYSLTNTLAGAFPEIKRVQILIEGSAVETLAGHIDTSRPFEPRPALNKG